jgi:hypothetical protein
MANGSLSSNQSNEGNIRRGDGSDLLRVAAGEAGPEQTPTIDDEVDELTEAQAAVRTECFLVNRLATP